MKVLADQKARDLISNELDKTLVVEAAAGTGKTTELVNRIIGGGRRISREIRELIFRMVAENPTWGRYRRLRPGLGLTGAHF